MADPAGSTPALTSRPRTSSATTKQRQSGASQMGPPAIAPNNAQQSAFGRFRLSEFQASPSTTTTTTSAGQCSRFRVSDFIPYDANTTSSPDAQQQQLQQQQQGGQVLNGAAAVAARQRAGSTPRASPQMSSATRPPGVGSFSVMHMDVEGAGAQATSTSVAATGGRGLLQKVNVQAQSSRAAQRIPKQQKTNVQQQQQQPQHHQQQHPTQQQMMAQIPQSGIPSPSVTPYPAIKFDPTQFSDDLRLELSRVVQAIQQDHDMLANKVVAALLAAPSLEEHSLLHRIGGLYPQQQQQQQPAMIPVAPEPEPVVPTKRKRGRPPGKKKDVVPAVLPVEVQAVEPAVSMAPPPVPQVAVVPARKEKDSIQTCTRCLKPFNPAWRPTPASDPSSEATCAVRHPHTDFSTALVLSLPARKRNNNKPTWRWRCCGREIQSPSDEQLDFPRKEDDKTGGWCFVGKHTTEPGVLQKLGLKSGKGKTIEEVADMSEFSSGGGGGGGEDSRKRQRLENGGGVPSSSPQQPTLTPPQQPPPLLQHQEHQLHQHQLQHQHIESTGIDSTWQPLHILQPPAQPPPQHPPPLETPVKRKRGRPKGSKSKPKLPQQPPYSPNPAPATSPTSQLLQEAHAHATPTMPHHPPNANGDQPHFWPYPDPTHDDAISSVDLGMLVSATAAMDGSSAEQPAVKRGRGRPKGVKNGAGKAAVEKKRLEEEQRRQEDVNAALGAGGGWFPEDEGWGAGGY